MAKTTETKDFVDHSIFYKFYALPLAIGYILWLAYIGYTDIYYGLMINHHVPVIDVGIQLAILWWLLDITLTKTTYRLEKDKLYMIKTGLWTKKELNLPYEDIFGVHHFKNQLMKPVTYRYTFHEYSKLDNRPIWSLLYDIGSDKKVGRVLMKASEEFWKEFEKRMPGQIRIPQEEVVMFTYKAMEKKLRDQGYFKDHPEMSFEEGIKQLRQKGTEMGGREDELTGADFHGEEVELENGTSKETLEAARRRKAIRDDEIAAEAMGINLAHHKQLAFSISSFFAGVGGAMLAMYQTTVQAKSFTSAMTYEILLIVVIGGVGSVTGSVFSSFLFVACSEWWLRFLDEKQMIGTFEVPLLRNGFRLVIFSLIIMIVVLFFRRGIMGTKELPDLFRRKTKEGIK